ncbi:MAG TPA: WecB/TagA/CpsF family glycosyltransferase, partial [Chitinophagaceae bacterium]|nr:WecB/TagA/CpsF family glycosyltransferase [Chitinophagaceae bacterium]
RNGYFKKEEESEIANEIANSGANILFVAMGSPKKENFLFNYKQVLQKLNFVMGVGGSFDVVAGKVKRAPVWVQKIGMEWFYRMAQEPRRLFMRYFTTNLALIKLILKEKLKKG